MSFLWKTFLPWHKPIHYNLPVSFCDAQSKIIRVNGEWATVFLCHWFLCNISYISRVLLWEDYISASRDLAGTLYMYSRWGKGGKQAVESTVRQERGESKCFLKRSSKLKALSFLPRLRLYCFTTYTIILIGWVRYSGGVGLTPLMPMPPTTQPKTPTIFTDGISI